jgi:hypothetical protein
MSDADSARTAAEDGLRAAFRHFDIADSRPLFRARMRALREKAPEAFDSAVADYEKQVLPRLAASTSPAEALGVWLEFGHRLARLEAEGRVVAIDADGRAGEAAHAPAAGSLLIFLPEATEHAALPLAVPASPSPAQSAALALLVEGRLEL